MRNETEYGRSARAFSDLLRLSLVVVLFSTFANASWSCMEWEKLERKISVLDTKDARWDGERISLRFWASERMRRSELELTYWAENGKKFTVGGLQRAEIDLLVSYSSQTWNTYTAQLRYRPSNYKLQRTVEFCKKYRGPTVWERMTQ